MNAGKNMERLEHSSISDRNGNQYNHFGKLHGNEGESEVTQSYLFATPWTVAHQARPSMGFSRQECWSELPFPSPEDLPDPGIEPGFPTL